MTIKTDYSRFDIHDELTAPEGSQKILKGVQTAGGEISKFLGVLAGSLISALLATVVLRARNRVYRRIRAQEQVDADADGVPDVYQRDADHA